MSFKMFKAMHSSPQRYLPFNLPIFQRPRIVHELDIRPTIGKAGRQQSSTEMSARSDGLCSINTFDGLCTSTGYFGFKRNTSSVSGSTPRSVTANDLRLDVRLKKEIVTVQSMGTEIPEPHRLAKPKELDRRREHQAQLFTPSNVVGRSVDR